MATFYNAGEVLEMGLEIERSGRRFYLAAAEHAEDPCVREVLSGLAEMEADHEDVFTQLKADLERGPDNDVAYDPEDVAMRYLSAVADAHVFGAAATAPEELVRGMSGRGVLKTAIQFEKDSVVFFLGLVDLVPDDMGKKAVEGLVREEMGHIATLSQQMDSLPQC
jgi:rubrerythrin